MSWINMGTKSRQSAFTMVELLFVMAIIAILLGVAIPIYRDYVVRAERAEGKNFLLRVQAAQERFYTNNSAYSNSMVGSGAAGLGFTSVEAPGGKFSVAIALTNGNQGYTMTLTPANGHADPDCTSLVVDNLGNKSATGATANKCWTR